MAMTVALVLELIGLMPRLATAGIALSELWPKMRGSLDEVPQADRDARWAEADAAVNELKARAFDPATDRPPP